MADSSFADQVHKVLSDPQSLPQEFLDYLVQYATQNPVPIQTVRAPAFLSTGLGDAIKGTRYVGSTTSGHPTTGYFEVGDFMIDQTAAIWVCIAAGSPGTWKVVAGGLSVPGLMAARVNIVGNQSVVEGTNVPITWGEAAIDTGTPSPFWSNAHPTRLTAPVNGAYLSLANLQWDVLSDANRPGYASSYLYKNGAAAYLYDVNQAEPSTVPTEPYNLQGNHHGIFELAAGDYLEMFAYNNNAGAANRSLIDLRPSENHYASWSLILVATT